MTRLTLLSLLFAVSTAAADHRWHTTRYLLTWEGGEDKPDLTWSPDGKYLVARGNVVSMPAGDDLGRLPGLSPPQFMPGGTRFLAVHRHTLNLYELDAEPTSATGDDAPRLRDGRAARLVAQLGREEYGREVAAVSPGGTRAATIDRGRVTSITLWDLASKKPLAVGTAGASLNALRFSGDGRTVVAGSIWGDDPTHVWDGVGGVTAQVPVPVGLRPRTHSINRPVSPDGRWAAEVWERHTVGRSTRDKEVVLIDLKAAKAYPVPVPGASAVAFTPEGRGLVVGYEDGTVRLHAAGADDLRAGRTPTGGTLVTDLSALSLPNTVRQYYPHVTNVAVSPDGDTIATSDPHGVVFLSRRGQPVRRPAASEWLPTALGTTWTYRTNDGEKKDVVIGQAVDDGRLVVQLARGGWQRKGVRTVEPTPAGLRLRFDRYHPTPADGLLWLPLPFTPGKPVVTADPSGTWESTAVPDAEAQVEVPAGRYPAVRVTITTRRQGQIEAVEQVWFSRGVGVVKRDVLAGSQRRLEELAAFELPRRQ